MPRFKSLLLMSVFIAAAVAAIGTHVWRQRMEAEFDPRPLYSAIFEQFEACRSDDFGKAYGQASRGVQERFTPVQYASKIRTEYGRISHPQKLQFGSTTLEDYRVMVKVYFLGDRDEITPALFTMTKENGIWRIENFEIYETWPSGRRIAGSSV